MLAGEHTLADVEHESLLEEVGLERRHCGTDRATEREPEPAARIRETPPTRYGVRRSAATRRLRFVLERAGGLARLHGCRR